METACSSHEHIVRGLILIVTTLAVVPKPTKKKSNTTTVHTLFSYSMASQRLHEKQCNITPTPTRVSYFVSPTALKAQSQLIVTQITKRHSDPFTTANKHIIIIIIIRRAVKGAVSAEGGGGMSVDYKVETTQNKQLNGRFVRWIWYGECVGITVGNIGWRNRG